MTPDISERAFEETIECALHHAANVISAAVAGRVDVRKAVPR